MMMSNTNNLILDSILGDVTHRDLFCPMTDSLIELLLQSPSKFIIDPQNFGMGDSFFVLKTNYNQNVISEASLKWGTIAQSLESFFEVLFFNIPHDQRPSFHFILGAVSLYGNMTMNPLTVNSYRKMKNAFLQLRRSLDEDFDSQGTLNSSLVALLSQREKLIKSNVYCMYFPGNLRAAIFSQQLRRISKILSVSFLPAKFHFCLVRIFNGWLCKSARFLKPSLIDLFCLFDVL